MSKKTNKKKDDNIFPVVSTVGKDSANDNVVADVEAEPVLSLNFPQYGWCHEITPPFRYKMGLYTPKNLDEYNALKKYSVQ